MNAKNILLHTPMIHGPKFEYEQGKKLNMNKVTLLHGFRKSWQISDLGWMISDVVKLKGNSYYGKMIEDLGCHKSTKVTRNELVVGKAFKSSIFILRGI